MSSLRFRVQRNMLGCAMHPRRMKGETPGHASIGPTIIVSHLTEYANADDCAENPPVSPWWSHSDQPPPHEGSYVFSGWFAPKLPSPVEAL